MFRVLFVLVLVAALLYLATALYASRLRNLAAGENGDSDEEEWTCPACGFHVQVGDSCIYCGHEKDRHQA